MRNNLIIGGVHKSGTTSLFKYLMEHPEICGSKKKEIHHFTPLRYGMEISSIESYYSYFLQCDLNVKYLLEASPSYLYGKEKIGTEILAQLNQPRIIFILRDPVERFISYYKHCESKFYVERDTTFKEFFEKNLANFSKEDLDDPFYRGLREGNYFDYVSYWLKTFAGSVKVVFFEDFVTKPKSEMYSICKWLNIDEKYYDNYNFTVENKTRRRKYLKIHRFLLIYYRRFEYFFQKNKGLKRILRSIYSGLNKSESVEIDELTKIRLKSFYNSSNKKLKNYLVAEGFKDLPNWLQNY